MLVHAGPRRESRVYTAPAEKRLKNGLETAEIPVESSSSGGAGLGVT